MEVANACMRVRVGARAPLGVSRGVVRCVHVRCGGARRKHSPGGRHVCWQDRGLLITAG